MLNADSHLFYNATKKIIFFYISAQLFEMNKINVHTCIM